MDGLLQFFHLKKEKKQDKEGCDHWKKLCLKMKCLNKKKVVIQKP